MTKKRPWIIELSAPQAGFGSPNDRPHKHIMVKDLTPDSEVIGLYDIVGPVPTNQVLEKMTLYPPGKDLQSFKEIKETFAGGLGEEIRRTPIIKRAVPERIRKHLEFHGI